MPNFRLVLTFNDAALETVEHVAENCGADEWEVEEVDGFDSNGIKVESSNKEEWIIQDWAGNRKFYDQQFKTFRAGVDFLKTQYEDARELAEFYVVPKSGSPDRE